MALRHSEVVGVTVDLDPRYVLKDKGHLGQRSGRLRGEPLVDMVLMNPRTDFTCSCTGAGMQTAAPKHLVAYLQPVIRT